MLGVIWEDREAEVNCSWPILRSRTFQDLTRLNCNKFNDGEDDVIDTEDSDDKH